MADGGYTPTHGSGTSKGTNVKVAATSTPGTKLHETGTSATELHVVTITAWNTDTVAHKLTIEFGGVTSPDDLIIFWVKPQATPITVCSYRRITGSGSVLSTVAAFADTANVVNCAVDAMKYQA